MTTQGNRIQYKTRQGNKRHKRQDNAGQHNTRQKDKPAYPTAVRWWNSNWSPTQLGISKLFENLRSHLN